MSEDHQVDDRLNPLEGEDLLWRQLKTLPAFRALLRSVEARFYQVIDLPQPILDLGCGDGHFATMVFDKPLDVGIDPWWGPINKAKRTDAYRLLVNGFGDRMPFTDDYFGTVISNSVLEHIPDIQPVINEVGRVLKPGGKFVVTMPTDYFTEMLGGALLFQRLGLNGPANIYRVFFNKISRHAHTDPPLIWAQRFNEAGLHVERWQYYFSEKALHALEVGHLQGAPSAICHGLTGHWILAPWESSLVYTERWLRPHYEEPFPEIGAMAIYVARKELEQPPPTILPPPQPFNLGSLEGQSSEPTWKSQDNYERTPHGEVYPATESVNTATRRFQPLVDKQSSGKSKSFFILIALAAAFLGIVMLRQDAPNPIGFFFWSGIALVAILLASSRKRVLSLPFRIPTFHHIKARSWLLIPAFLLSIIAYHLANSASPQPRPYIALSLWLLGIILASFSLSTSNSEPSLKSWLLQPMNRTHGLILAAILLLGFTTRLLWLTSHPFILSGSEASIGLEVKNVINGNLQLPFATGWLTNPTLGFFILSVPFRIIKDPILSVRLMSPIIGVLSITTIYFTGRVLFGAVTGLVAAALLAMSHIFIHYSRIGLTNGWDPLLITLILGLFYAAWRMNKRSLWLLAGLCAGLGAYSFTTVHLLPLFLIIQFMLIIIRWSDFKEQKGHIFAALVLALVVALPQILFYVGAPEAYWERWQAIGIFQANWFIDENARTGQNLGQLIARQFWYGLLSLNVGVDQSNVYPSGRYLLGTFASVMMIIGFLLSLIRIRQLRFLIVIAWLLIPLIVGGVLTVNAPSSHRLLIAVPAAYLLIAIAVVWLGNLAIAQFSPKPAAVLIVGFGLALLIGFFDLSFYFGPFRTEHRFGDRNTEIAHRISDFLNTLEGNWRVTFYGAPNMYASFPTFAYLVDGWQEDIFMVDAPENAEILVTPDGAQNIFIFLPERSDEIESVQSQLSSGELESFSGYFADPLFYTYRLPAN